MVLKIAISAHWVNQNEKATFGNSSTLKIITEDIRLLFWEKLDSSVFSKNQTKQLQDSILRS